MIRVIGSSAPIFYPTFLTSNKNYFLHSGLNLSEKPGAIAHYKAFGCPRTHGMGAQVGLLTKEWGHFIPKEVIL